MIYIYRLSNWFYYKQLKLVSKLIDYLNYLLFNSILPGSTKIGKGTVLAYGGIGLVIHANAEIGDNCIIGQGITIGGRSKHLEVPVIGNNVYLGPGCRVLGPILIGDNVIIGANSVVIQSIEAGSIVVGIPGKVIKSDIKMEDFV